MKTVHSTISGLSSTVSLNLAAILAIFNVLFLPAPVTAADDKIFMTRAVFEKEIPE